MAEHQLSKEQFDRLVAAIEKRDRASAEEMPTDKDAIEVMFRAWERLKKLGWREAMYCPKDGSQFDVIEAGSTGIHRCHYEGEWPTGSWIISDDGDQYPSRPILFRLDPEAEKERQQRLNGLRAAFSKVRGLR